MSDPTRTADFLPGPHSTLSPADPPTQELAAPAATPGFELGEVIGVGGMGVVHRARDRALKRDVAVKVLKDSYPPDGAAARRFVAEAEITAQLQHPGIPPVYHAGRRTDGRPFLAMKLIKGETLADLLAGSPDRGRLVAAFEGVCQAVAYAHAHGVIHRDLKPANVMVGAFGEVQVMDWGLAKVLDERPEATPSADDPEATAAATEIQSHREESDHTQDGQALGTPAYMAPEQAVGDVAAVDRRSDVFGLGAVLCHLLTGRPPYLGADAASTRVLAARAKLDDALAALAGCGADPGLVALCRRCLSAEKADRPADAGAVADAVAALRRAADDRARRAEVDAAEGRVRRRLQLRLGGLAAAVLVAGAAGVGVQWRRAERALAAVTDQERETAAALVGKTAEGQAKAAALADAEVARGKTVEALRVLTSDFVDTLLARKSTFTDEDRDFLRKVLALWQTVADTRGDSADARELRAEGYSRVGYTQRLFGETADAEAAYRNAVAVRERLVADFPAVPMYRHHLAGSLNDLGYVLRETGKAAEADAAHRSALAICERLLSEFPAVREYRYFLALSHKDVGILLRDAGKAADAEAAFRSAVAVLDGLAREFPTMPYYRYHLADTHNRLGLLLRDTGKAAAADAEFRQDLALLEGLAGELSALPEYRGRRANALLLAGQVERAVAETAELIALPGRRSADDWYDFACTYSVASGKLADQWEGHATRAVELLRKAVAAGYRDRKHMTTDADLAPLRGRADFRAVLNSLPEVAPPPRPVR